MGRRREPDVGLPDYVHRVTSKGRSYFYFQEHRGTEREGERIPITGSPYAPPDSPDFMRFWAEYNKHPRLLGRLP